MPMGDFLTAEEWAFLRGFALRLLCAVALVLASVWVVRAVCSSRHGVCECTDPARWPVRQAP